MIVVTKEATFQSGNQFKLPLLCQACEIRFQQGGETWTLGNRYRSDGSFPLRNMLLAAKPETQRPDGARIYQARTLSGLEVNQLIYFAASLFWRAGIADWSVRFANAPKIDLDAWLMNELRDYLLGTAPFPARASIFVIVDAETAPQRALMSPVKVTERPLLRYQTYIPGIVFELGVDLASPLRDLSLDSPVERIMLSDIVTKFVQVMGSTLSQTSEPKGSLKKHFQNPQRLG